MYCNFQLLHLQLNGWQTLFQRLSAGFPTPRVYWFKDGTPLQASSRIVLSTERDQHSLEILDVKREDTGEYSAYISNIAGSAYSSARLNVLGKCCFYTLTLFICRLRWCLCKSVTRIGSVFKMISDSSELQ